MSLNDGPKTLIMAGEHDPSHDPSRCSCTHNMSSGNAPAPPPALDCPGLLAATGLTAAELERLLNAAAERGAQAVRADLQPVLERNTAAIAANTAVLARLAANTIIMKGMMCAELDETSRRTRRSVAPKMAMVFLAACIDPLSNRPQETRQEMMRAPTVLQLMSGQMQAQAHQPVTVHTSVHTCIYYCLFRPHAFLGLV